MPSSTMFVSAVKSGLAAASAAVTDYYALGTVSDSDLTYYAPTVSIDEYAQIYKYTTLTKLTNYGEDVPDKSILTVFVGHGLAALLSALSKTQ